MHDDVLSRISMAIESKRSIEACWLCYACFESRITRTLEKVSGCCPKRACVQNQKVGIITRIDCLKRLKKIGYAGAEHFDSQLLGQIKKWCLERNTLVHALITLSNYYDMDDKFLQLAIKGKPLVDQLYFQTTNFRNEYYRIAKLPMFPEGVFGKCRLIEKRTK